MRRYSFVGTPFMGVHYQKLQSGYPQGVSLQSLKQIPKGFIISFGILLTTIYANAGLTDFQTIEEAKEAYSAKDYNKTVSLLESMKTNDASSELHYNLGNSYYKKAEYEKAIEEYKTSKGVDEASRQYNLGNSYFQNGDFNKSVESFKKSLEYRDDIDTQNNLKVAKKALKRKKEEEKKKQDKNNKKNDKKDKKKEDKKDQKKNDKDKKKQNDKKKKDDKKKESDKKKDEKKKKEEAKKKEQSDKKGKEKNKKPSEAQQKKAKAKKMNEKELKRLLRKMKANKAPIMKYQMGNNNNKQRSEDENPW